MTSSEDERPGRIRYTSEAAQALLGPSEPSLLATSAVQLAAAMDAAYRLMIEGLHLVDRLERDLPDAAEHLTWVLPAGHVIPAGAQVRGIPVAHGDVDAPMIALRVRL